MLFGRRNRLSQDLKDWIEDSFDWFDARFLPPPKPILPTAEFFKAAKGHDHAAAKAVLKDVQRLLRFDLPIELVPLARPSAEYRHSYQSAREVAGTYQETEEGRFIQYDPEMLWQPLVFINVMAHEVMHARLAGLEDQIPGGRDAHELATDLGCIIAGFGVFQLQAADDQGWSGYMTQESRAHALAVFLDQRGLTPDAVNAFLSGRVRKYLKRAWADLSLV
ncbi:MAG: hypothetical protein AAGO57_00645 [Pseudomonadota bacterium]